MAIYRDRVFLNEIEKLIAWRSGSLEFNELKANVVGARVCIDGCWGIASVQGEVSESKVKELLGVAEKVARASTKCPGLSEAKLFTGSVSIGVKDLDLSRIADMLPTLCSEASAEGVEDCEVVVLHRAVERIIESDHGEAKEVKSWIEVEVGLSSRSSFGSWRGFSIAWSTESVERIIDEVFRAALNVYRASSKAKPLHPFNVGKAALVLDPEATAALIHELSHALTPPFGKQFLGLTIASSEITVVDDPAMMGLPSSRLFDDEGVECRKRTLIEGGRVIDLHHTRETAHSHGSSPGSAHGLFTKPIPFHTNLVLNPGDWKFKEIIEETKSGYLIVGAAMATLEGGYVRIVPMASYRVERGELKEPIKLRCIKIPFRSLRTIDALGRELRARYSYEKSWLVAEIAPSSRLVGYVE